MIWHPLLIAVVVGDVLSFLLWLGASGTAFKIAVKWAPHSANREQIKLERKAETARLSAKFSLVVFILSTTLLIIGIANILPAIVPGAMCGTGVLQATDGLGAQALIYRFFVFFIMMLWSTYEKLDLSQPDAPLTRYNSRLLLLALPFFLLAVITTLRGILRIDSHQPVSCCAIVYDQFGNLAAARQIAGIPNIFLGLCLLDADGLDVFVCRLVSKNKTSQWGESYRISCRYLGYLGGHRRHRPCTGIYCLFLSGSPPPLSLVSFSTGA